MVCIYTSAAVDLLVDVSGYFPSAEGYVAKPAPIRVLDTRS